MAAAGRRAAKLEGQWLRATAQAGPWEAASLRSRLKSGQGCAVRELRLSGPLPSQGCPELTHFASCPAKAWL